MARLLHVLHLILINFLYLILIICLFFKRTFKKQSKASKDIALLPYTPLGWYGGDIRIANWKEYLEKDGYKVDLFWAWDTKDSLKYDKSSWLNKYLIYAKIVIRRFFTFFKLFHYKTIWVQRAYVPLYPFKNAIFESLLKKSNINWVIDFYDPDYRHNPIYVNKAALSAKKVTVVNSYLSDYYIKIGGENVSILNLTLDNKKYVVKNSYSFSDKIVIGWMGSPANSSELFEIKDALILIQNKYKNVVFCFICNKMNCIDGINCEIVQWQEESFYYNLNSFDIGIVPISYKKKEYLKGKVAMKSVEMMASGIPIVCSPFGISNSLFDGKNALFADSSEDWFEKISLLIDDEMLRSKIGKSAQFSFEENHTYESQFEKLKNILF